MYLPCLRLLIATGVVLFHNPSQTSPNCPCPSLRTNFKLPRSISHWSRVECDKSAVTGFSIYKKREKKIRSNVYYTSQFKKKILIWISCSFKKGASDNTISYFEQSPSGSLASDLVWSLIMIWGDLVKISRGEQRTEREQMILFF